MLVNMLRCEDRPVRDGGVVSPEVARGPWATWGGPWATRGGPVDASGINNEAAMPKEKKKLLKVRHVQHLIFIDVQCAFNRVNNKNTKKQRLKLTQLVTR